MKICVVGGGLAGSELAFQLAQAGVEVDLFEPRLSGFNNCVHSTKMLAELVCSNSLRGEGLHNAAGLLKEELRKAGSFLISVADKTRIPAGGALAVARDSFSEVATSEISSHSKIKLIPEEVTNIEDLKAYYDFVVIATGPLTSSSLASELSKLSGNEDLYFYDAIAPIVAADSLDMDICFNASRYDKGEASDYINAPLSKEQYSVFVTSLLDGEKIPIHKGDKGIFFNACMPVEVMAESGPDTLLFGPMRGDGLREPKTGKCPHAAVQFRQDNASASMYNIVGFQTRLTYGEQDRVFRTIPGLKNVECLRYGSMHRNTYVNAPEVLNVDMSFINDDKIFLAGQISGVEGYVESIAHGFIVARYILDRINNKVFVPFPVETAMGALSNYLSVKPQKDFQPMKINFGLIPPLSKEEHNVYLKGRGKFEHKMATTRRALDVLGKYL